MKIPNKQELQQIVFNHLSDIGFEDSMNLYKTCTSKPYSFLLINTTVASDKTLHLRCNLLEIIQKLIVTIDDEIRDKKMPYDINQDAAKMSA